MEQLGFRHKAINAAKKSWKFGNFVYIFAIMLIIYIVLLPRVKVLTIMNILSATAVVGTIALGMGLIIISGEIDLSVGSILAFSGGIGILCYNKFIETMAVGTATFLTFLVIILISVAASFLNGYMIGKVKLPAFIATLGTMLILRSMSKYILAEASSGGAQQTAVYQINGYDQGTPLFEIGNKYLLNFLPLVGFVFIVLTIIIWYLAKYTKFGRKIYALGSNKKASELAGINVPWMKIAIFTLSGLLIGLAGCLHVAYYGSVDSTQTGVSYELYAIASCVIGGIAMTGGRGNVIGILFGALSFQTIDFIINTTEIDSNLIDSIKGCILLVAVGIQVVVVNKQTAIKYLQKIGLLFNPHMDEIHQSTLRIKINDVSIAYDKKINKVLKTVDNKEEADRVINELLDARDLEIGKITALYNKKIENDRIRISEYKLRKENENIIDNNLTTLIKLRRTYRAEFKEIKTNDPKLISLHLNKSIELTNNYFEKAIELANNELELLKVDELYRSNAKLILDRDKEIDSEKAQATYDKTIAKIDNTLNKNIAKYERKINSLNEERDKLINKFTEKLEANRPLEAEQAEQNAEAVKKINAKSEAKKASLEVKETKAKEKEANELANKEREANEAKERKQYLNSIYKRRGEN